MYVYVCVCIYVCMHACMYVCICNSCNMGTRDLPDMYARGLRAYISGKSRVHMLQVICNTSGTLKICPNLMSIFPPLYIVTGTRCDCGTLFHRCHDVLAW